jgi:signal transduction histidine kinase
LNEDKLRRLIEVGRGIVAELDLDAVLERVLEVACELTGAQYAALGVLDDRREQLERFITRGIDGRTRAAIGDLPRGHGVLGTLIRKPEPLRIADVGRHPESWGFPPAHPAMTTFLGVPIVIRGAAYGNLYLTEKAGGEEFNDTDEEAMLVLADWAAVAIHNAQAHRLVSGRRDELERAVRGLEATTEIARAVGAETRLDRVLELIVKRGRAIVGARIMSVMVQEGDEVVVAAAAGDVDQSLIGLRLPMAESVSGEVMSTQRPLRLSDMTARLRAGLASRVGATSGLFVPMRFQGRPLGVLNAFDRIDGGPEFDRDDEQIMEAFASSAAVAVATAQQAASDALRRSMEATEHERSRWARELHDETLQDLAALAIRLSGARDLEDADEMRRVIGESVEQASAAAQALRGLITDLRPAALDQLGLQPALEALAERVTATTAVTVDLRLDLATEDGVTRRLAAETESAAYRLVQEALTNVVKHANAERASATVTERDGEITITVADEGVGFSPHRQESGFGLIGMRERIALVGGSVEVRAAPGEGTTVRATLPAIRLGETGVDPAAAVPLTPERRIHRI